MKNLLTLNKKTIAKLNKSQLTAIKGGSNDTVVNCCPRVSLMVCTKVQR